MSDEGIVKEFEKTTEVLPFTKYGLFSYADIQAGEKEVQHIEHLKKLGLTNEEVKLYQDNESGLLNNHKKVESSVLKAQLKSIYKRVNAYQDEAGCFKDTEKASTSDPVDIFSRAQKNPITFYPEGHPMNEIKQLEECLFGHFRSDIIPITKRRKMLRRLERRKQRILAQEQQLIPTLEGTSNVPRKDSLWDVKVRPKASLNAREQPLIGPKKQTLYTIKDHKIVRLEPVNQIDSDEVRIVDVNREYQAVDIVIPVNAAEEQLLEGTKMCVDDIKKIERFKDYKPGIPSKVLYLKNIALSVNQDQIALLFNQFQLENGGPIDVRLMSGRMRGQAFVSFQDEQLAIRALEEVNGTILCGKPVVIQFGRNSNRIQDDNR